MHTEWVKMDKKLRKMKKIMNFPVYTYKSQNVVQSQLNFAQSHLHFALLHDGDI